MRIKETPVYKYDELSEKAKERAREWFLKDYPDHEWWDYLYEDFAQRAQELGITLGQKPVPLMNGKTRYEPEIYFTGFYHQGSGSSFNGIWHSYDIQLDKLKKECPTDTELHRIGKVLADCAKEDPGLAASITPKGDNWISVAVHDGEVVSDTLEELESDSPEYRTLAEACRKREEDVTEALRDFNRWMYKQLEKEYEYLVSDEQVEETIRANKYEFTEEGERI